MATSDNPYIENLHAVLGKENIISPNDIARLLSLYIKVFNDNGVVRNVSKAYIDNYDGKSIYRKFKKHFDRLYELFLKNNVDERERHTVFKKVAERVVHVPKNNVGMEHLVGIVIDETKRFLKNRRLVEGRQKLVERFKSAVKKYLHLTYSLGYNEPSQCVKTLAEQHRLDKYVMSGDFPLLLLPFMPELAQKIRDCYEHYEMQDAWEVFKGRYYDHVGEYSAIAVEIKSTFNRTIPNFTDYFDRMYTDTYYRKMLELQQRR
jgi:hypothetical protein